MDSTIVAANSATTDPDLDGTVINTTTYPTIYSIIGNNTGITIDGNPLGSTDQVGTSSNPINPVLDQLGYYGGLTQTLAVLPGSPAIQKGDPNAANPIGSSNFITTDQRGFSRGTTPDVGAYVSQTYTHFEVTAQQYVNGGTALNFTVAVVDQYNNFYLNNGQYYTGTAHFSSSDGSATLPVNYTFTSADQDLHTFTATLVTDGNQTIMATDTSTSSITGSCTVSVTPQLIVTNTNDVSSGSSGYYGSLRWAVSEANTLPGPNTITFGSLFNTAQTITLSSSLGPLILRNTSQTTITGPGASLLTVSGNNDVQAFEVILETHESGTIANCQRDS
jgi:hypothetical protein